MKTMRFIVYKKFIAIVVCLVIGISMPMTFNSCSAGSNEYPVKVANVIIKKAPEKVVVLSDNVADILTAIGYDIKIIGRSDKCTQTEIKQYVPSVGSAEAPDVSAIKALEADLVFADTSLEEETKKQITDAGIDVIATLPSDSFDELKVLYNTIGKIMGGNKTGLEKAKKGYDTVISNISSISDLIPKEQVKNNICYLYLEKGVLTSFNNKTIQNELFAHTNTINIAENLENNIMNNNVLLRANPDFIFYSDDETLEVLKSDNFKNLKAVKEKKLYKLPFNELNRQGFSLVEAVNLIAKSIFPKLDATPDSVIDFEDDLDITSVAEEYGINITDDLVLKLEDENNNVKILQKRLIKLKYLDSDATGYYGDMTKDAVKEFADKHDLSCDGTSVNAEILNAIFSRDAKDKP